MYQALFWAWEDNREQSKPRSLPPRSCPVGAVGNMQIRELSEGSKCWGASEAGRGCRGAGRRSSSFSVRPGKASQICDLFFFIGV